jgi:hypothetical protein
MGEVKYDKSHPAGGTPEARIASRLRNSGSPDADVVVQKGSAILRSLGVRRQLGNGDAG